jgi:hypothetical protein
MKMNLPRIKKRKIYPSPITFNWHELRYIGAAVGQFDIEFEKAPESLVDKLISHAERNGIDTTGWAK